MLELASRVNSRPPRSATAAGVCLALLVASAGGQEEGEDSDMALPPISVRGIRVAPELPADRMRVEMFLSLQLGLGWSNNTASLITPSRVPQSPRNIAFTIGDPLVVRRDESLPGDPVRLRGLRALVLRDRLPAANPFDGSTPWNEMPRGGLEIVVGGGATAWDGGAMGGAIQFLSQPPSATLVTEKGNGRGRAIDGGPLKRRVLPIGNLTASIGGLDTRRADWVASQPTTRGILQVQGGIHSTAGYELLAPTQRGPIDEPAWNRGRWLEANWRQPAGKFRELTASVRTYENSTGHGTPGQHRQEHGTRVSLAMAGNPTGGPRWNGAIYGQHDDAAAALTSSDAPRLAETPARRLAKMPTSAVGASWTGAWWHFGDSRTILGADLRHVRGESREEFDFAGGNFRRESIAGGKQSRLGLSILQQQPFGANLLATFGARLEAWHETSGRRREIDRASGAILRDERLADDEGAGLVPSAGLVWQLPKRWRVRVNGQSTFRRPTLAERFQTWGVQGVITDANPALDAEKNLSFEAALEYGTAPGLTVGAKVFHNRLSDLIGSQASVSGLAPLPGLAFRQWINLSAEIQGLQFSLGGIRYGPVSLSSNLLLNQTRIATSATTPALSGKELPRLPDRIASLNAAWKATEQLSLGLTVRSTGRQFADEENSRRMPDALLTDIRASYRLNRQAQFFLRVENIADVRHETNRDSAGLRYLGSPRVVTGEVRLNW